MALALSAQEFEPLLAIDAFSLQQHNVDQSGMGDYGIFVGNMARFGLAVNETVPPPNSAAGKGVTMYSDGDVGVKVAPVAQRLQVVESNSLELSEHMLTKHPELGLPTCMRIIR